MSIRVCVALLACSVLLSCTGKSAPRAEDLPIAVPVTDQSGYPATLRGHICRPAGVQKPELVILNHGSPPDAKDRLGMPLISCNNEAVQWFLARHYAVVIVLRLGYGATGGDWTEGFPLCDDADHYHEGMETARQIDAIVDYAVTLPDVDPQDVIVIGHSAGGWGTVAYDSMPHPHVSAFINMAGGRGGHYWGQINRICHVDQLHQAMARYGTTASTPMLWVYAANDTFFDPHLASQMLDDFRIAGGQADLFQAGPYDPDGHLLFLGRGGSAVWGPQVEAYLAARRANP